MNSGLHCLFVHLITYRYKPIRVQPVDQAGHEAHLTDGCENMEMQMCDGTEWRPMEPKPWKYNWHVMHQNITHNVLHAS